MWVADTASETIGCLYREQAAKVWRALLAYCGDREVASDATAEAFVQLIRRGEGVRDPVAWVWRVAFRVAAGQLKERDRTTDLVIDRAVEPNEAGVDLVRALSRLSPKQRGALVLYHYAGYRVKEIAGILDSMSAAVKVHLSMGRHRLRELLEDRDG